MIIYSTHVPNKSYRFIYLLIGNTRIKPTYLHNFFWPVIICGVGSKNNFKRAKPLFLSIRESCRSSATYGLKLSLEAWI